MVAIFTVIFVANSDYIRKKGVIKQINSIKNKINFPHLKSDIDFITWFEFQQYLKDSFLNLTFE